MKKLRHPNIVQLLDLLHDEENYYIATEYCSGGTLKDKIEKKLLSEQEAAKIMK